MFASYFFNLRKIVVIGFLAVSLFIEGMNNPQAPQPKQRISQRTTAPLKYYTKENLAELKAKKMQPHAPCLILIDFSEQEVGSSGATLANALSAQGYPILVTSSLLKTLLQILQATTITTTQTKNIRDTAAESFTNENWNAYLSAESNLVLLNPKKFSSAFLQTSFAFDQLEDISELIPTQAQVSATKGSYAAIEKLLVPSKNQAINPNEFKQFFYSKKDAQKLLPVWDFFIAGHGDLATYLMEGTKVKLAKRGRIAGLFSENLNHILDVFDQYIDTGVVYLLSCNLGGVNANLLQTKESGIHISHNFILIIGATTDAPIIGGLKQAQIAFFNTAALLSDYGTSLNNLAASVTEISTLGKQGGIPRVHGTERIPQLWLPNGMGFQTFELDSFIYSIGNVKAKVVHENKQSLMIQNKQAVLVYPSIIEAPVFIWATAQKNWMKFPEKQEEAKQATWARMPMLSEKNFWTAPKEIISVNDLSKNEIMEELLGSYPSLAQMPDESAHSYLFPQIISMRKQPHLCIFKYIRVDTSIATLGLMRFIRDSFLDIGHRSIQQTFCIEELVGYNDFSLLLEANRLASSSIDVKMSELEKHLSNKKDQRISLYNFSIATYFDTFTKKDAFVLMFNLSDGSAWALNTQKLSHTPGAIIWNDFYLISAEYPKKILDETRLKLRLSPNQTPISQTLQEKQLDIAKQPIIKKAEAAKIPRAQRLKLIHEDAIKHALQAIANKDLIYFRNALASGVDLGNQHDVQLLKKVINQTDIPNKSAYLEALMGKSKGQ